MTARRATTADLEAKIEQVNRAHGVNIQLRAGYGRVGLDDEVQNHLTHLMLKGQLLDHLHTIDKALSMKARKYAVWVGGVAVWERVPFKEAEELAEAYRKEGYDDVQITKADDHHKEIP